jgi:hypothetical protein
MKGDPGSAASYLKTARGLIGMGMDMGGRPSREITICTPLSFEVRQKRSASEALSKFRAFSRRGVQSPDCDQ